MYNINSSSLYFGNVFSDTIFNDSKMDLDF